MQTDASTPLGGKGVGEIGQVRVAAAMANAVFNATGRRLRRLPLAVELVMDPAPAFACRPLAGCEPFVPMGANDELAGVGWEID